MSGNPAANGGRPGAGFDRPGARTEPFAGNGQAARGYAEPRGETGVRSGAFSGYDRGGQTRGFSSRGGTSFGASRGGGSPGGASRGGGASHGGGRPR
jgi:hypothetical protein